MRISSISQFNRHMRINRSNDTGLDALYNAPQGTDVIELRLEGP